MTTLIAASFHLSLLALATTLASAGSLPGRHVGVAAGLPGAREIIWADNFDAYSSDADAWAAGWTRGMTTNSPGSWRIWDTEGPMLGTQSPSLTRMSDKYMISNSDLSGGGIDIDEEIVSKMVDCSDHVNVRLDFSVNYLPYDDPEHLQVAEVDIRVYSHVRGWSGWSNLRYWDRESGSSSSSEQVDIGQTADQSLIQLRFHFYEAEWDYWFAFDNVIVSGEPAFRIKSVTLSDGRVILSWTAFGIRQYTVQQRESLVRGTWANAPGTWPIGAQTWTSGDVSGKKMLVYRVMSWP